MTLLTLQFLFAHIVGDFVLQPDSWVKDKKKHKHKSAKLYWHLSVHALVLVSALKFDFAYWLGILIVLLSHFLIDVIKLLASDKLNSAWLFFVDQLLHLVVILAVVNYYEPFPVSCEVFNQEQALLLIVFLLLLTFVSSVCMRVLISKWKPEEKKSDAMKNAGSYIGMLERLFIFGFILIDFWEGIGFLLAAKSVFRFGDLTKANDRNLTEYILIGTLLSFGLAILIAQGYKHMLGYLG